MAIKKKSLTGPAASNSKDRDSAVQKTEAKPERRAASAPGRKLALAKLATAKLSTAKLTTLRKLM